jgi:hypothetical protein
MAMRILLAVWLGAGLLLALPATARADIPPPPPPGLEKSPCMRPLPIVVGGVATALAIGLGGVFVARSRSSVLVPFLGGAVIVLAVAGMFAWRADQAWAKHEWLEAEYKKTLANWRPHGPIDREPYRNPSSTQRAVAVLSFAPQDGFPHNIPWAALAANVNAPPKNGPGLRP